MLRKGLIPFLIALLVAAPLLGAGPGKSQAASPRFAVIQELSGQVTVRLGGGSKEYQAYPDMTLNQGDVVTTGEDGSITLAFFNGTGEDDSITAAPNTALTFSKLSNSEGTMTHVSVLKGTVWSDVHSIRNEKDQFRIQTPTADMSARGTHFLVSIDPITGTSSLYTAAGIVKAQPTGTPAGQNKSVLVYPAQQISIDRDVPADLENSVSYVDLEQMVSSASPDVIEAILKNGSQIQQENSDLVEKLQAKASAPLGQTPGVDSLQDLEKYKGNLDALVGAIANEALNQRLLTNSQLQKILDSTDELKNLSLTPNKLTLTDVQQEKIEEAKRKLEDDRQQALKEQQQLLQQQQLMMQILEFLNRLKELNQSITDMMKQQAVDAYLAQLPEAERQKFLEVMQKLENNPSPPSLNVPSGPPTPSGPSTPSGPTTPTVPTNHAPTDVTLSRTSIIGRLEANAQVGTLSATDSDSGDTFAYSLVEGDGSIDNGRFAIEGSHLLTADTLAPGVYHILVKATDAGGLSFRKAFTLTVVSSETSGEPQLSSLTLTGAALSPAFDPAVKTYSVIVDPSVSQIGVQPTVGAGATVTVNGYLVNSGDVHNLTLAGASQTDISIVVTGNADGQTSTYRITVSNLPPSVERWEAIADGKKVNWYYSGETDGQLTYALNLDEMPEQSFVVNYEFAEGVESPELNAEGVGTVDLDTQAGTISYPIAALNNSDNNAYVSYTTADGTTVSMHLVVNIGTPDLAEFGLQVDNDGSVSEPEVYPTGPDAVAAYVPSIGSTLYIQSGTWGDMRVEPYSEEGYALHDGWNTFDVKLYYPYTDKLVSRTTLNVLANNQSADWSALEGIEGTDDSGNPLTISQTGVNSLSWEGGVDSSAASVYINPVPANGWTVSGVYTSGEYWFDMNRVDPTDDMTYNVPLGNNNSNIYVVLSDGQHLLTYSVNIYPVLTSILPSTKTLAFLRR